MTPLTQQLEDKKKRKEKLQKDNRELERNRLLNDGYQDDWCYELRDKNRIKIKILKAEIAILEQAIAEMKNIQSQENEKANDNIALLSTAPKGDVAKPESSRAINGDGNSPDTSNLLQKQRQEILDWIKEHEFTQNQGGYLIYADEEDCFKKMTSKLSIDYQQIPDARLFSLLDIDFKEELETEMEIMNRWVREKKCSCCLNQKIIDGEELLNCQHLKEEWKNKMSDLDKKINKKIKILVFRRLSRLNRLSI